MAATDLHTPTGAADDYASHLDGSKRLAAALLGHVAAASASVRAADTCLAALLARSAGADGDLAAIDYEDATEDFEAISRALRNLRRIGKALRAEIEEAQRPAAPDHADQ
ncbi:hypothetical protein [Nonomuraea recticatena]|uniref:Uncharacterized protein n=1 Tax=Nonomuraea recticatena TaxID=46178 RepID=A0ABP6F6S1_9ACTN